MASNQRFEIWEYLETPVLAVIVFESALTARLFHWFDMSNWRMGIPRVITPPDTSGFLTACDLWMNAPLELLLSYRGLLFSGFTIPFCSVLGLSGGSLIAWVAVQIVLSSLACVLVFFTVRRVLHNLAGFIAGMSLAVVFDVIRYDMYALSDPLFVFVLALSIYALTRYETDRTRQNKLLVYGCLVWLGVTRPVGPPVLLMWLLYDLLPMDNDHRLGLVPRRIAVGSIVSLFVIGIYFYSFSTVRSPGTIFNRFARGTAVSRFPDWADYWGLVKHSYTPRDSAGPINFMILNADHILIIILKRIAIFFSPYIESPWWAEWKVRYNTVLLVVMELCTVLGVYRLFEERSPVLKIWITPLVAFVFIAIVNPVDPSLRRTIPANVVYALLTGYVLGVPSRQMADDIFSGNLS